MGVCDILPIGRKEDVESTGSTRVLGFNRDRQCRRVESTIGTLEEISSKDNREPRNSSTTYGALHAYRGEATCVK